jgi:Uma2 family endonuclease
MAAVKPLLTYDDLAQLPDDGKRYELLEGELIVSPAPTPRHQRAVGLIVRFLGRAEDAGHGQVYVAPLYVVFDEDNVAEPDVLFIRTERLYIVGEADIRGAPDLVVEVLSASTRRRDLRPKLQIYARYRVPYYWIVDPDAETVQVYELGDEGYRAPITLRAGQQLGCPLFPGITIDVGRLFA